jgi:hypothetical protein
MFPSRGKWVFISRCDLERRQLYLRKPGPKCFSRSLLSLSLLHSKSSELFHFPTFPLCLLHFTLVSTSDKPAFQYEGLPLRHSGSSQRSSKQRAPRPRQRLQSKQLSPWSRRNSSQCQAAPDQPPLRLFLLHANNHYSSTSVRPSSLFRISTN